MSSGFGDRRSYVREMLGRQSRCYRPADLAFGLRTRRKVSPLPNMVNDEGGLVWEEGRKLDFGHGLSGSLTHSHVERLSRQLAM